MVTFQKLSKRGLAMLLVLIMCLSMMQISAFAAESDDVGGADVSSSETDTSGNTGESSGTESPSDDNSGGADTEDGGSDANTEDNGDDANTEDNGDDANTEDGGDDANTEDGSDVDTGDQQDPEAPAVPEVPVDPEAPVVPEVPVDPEAPVVPEIPPVTLPEVIPAPPVVEVVKELSVAAKAFVAAVDALPGAVTEDNFDEIGQVLENVGALYAALTEEEQESEEVMGAYLTFSALYEQYADRKSVV